MDACVPAIVAKSKFRQRQRRVIFRYFVIAAHNAAPEQRPEQFDGLRMNFAPNEFIAFVRDELMRITDLL